MKTKNLLSLALFAGLATTAAARSHIPGGLASSLKPGAIANLSSIHSAVLVDNSLFTPKFQSSLKSLEFKAYSYLEPKSGKPIAGTAIITLPNGKSITAAEYYAELNQHEQYLSSQGYSLKDETKDDFGTVQKPLSTNPLKLAQMNLIMKSVKAPQIKEKDVAAFKQSFAFNPKSATANFSGVFLSPISGTETKPAGNCTSADSVVKSESWPKRFGDSEFNVSLNAAMRFEASCDRVAGTAEAGADGTLFSNGFNLANGKVVAEAVRNKHYKINTDVLIIGKKVFDYDRSQANSFSAGDSFSKTIPVEVSAKVPVGPLRLALKAGARGTASFVFSFKFDGLSAVAALEPNISSNAYAEAGLNAYVAEAGAGADLLLASIKLPMSALAEVKPQGGRFVAHGKIFGQLALKALDGKIFAFVKVWAPSWSNPFRMKTYRVDITDWDGWIFNSTLFNYDASKNLI